MNNQEILQNITKYTQALCGDCMLCFSGDNLIATEDRKALARATLQLVENNLDTIKKQLA